MKLRKIFASIALLSIFAGSFFAFMAHAREQQSETNLELLLGYSRLHLLLNKISTPNEVDRKVENLEFIRLYLMSDIDPACRENTLGSQKLLCRLNSAAQLSGNEALKNVTQEKIVQDSQQCNIEISRQMCANYLVYKGKKRLLPNFQRLDEALEEERKVE